jgi:glycosyltransferase involved in cell wall biosynthesis
MKILYDHLCFWEKYGGVSKYFVKLINNISGEIQYDIAIKYTNNEYIKELSLVNIKKIFDNISFRGKARLISALNKPYSIASLRQGNYDIYHQTHYNPYGYRYLQKNKKSITTIYDMNFFVIPEKYKKSHFFTPIMRWQKESVEKADRIITISENTKNDLMNLWNIPESKINVIYLGVDDIVLDMCDKKRFYTNPYILFVGQRHSYKNFRNYLEAFKILSKVNRDLMLVCTGSSFSVNEKKILYQMGLSDRVTQISANEDEMISLYYNAELFVYPSFYEGFGLPLLEAMSCCCPIICSRTSCFPEIAQNAALYFEPNIIESMVEITQKLLDSNEMRKNLIQNGLQRKKDFSWKKCTDEHINAYKNLLNE